MKIYPLLFSLIPLCLLACSENRDTLLAKAATHLENQKIDEAKKIYHRLYKDDSLNPEIIEGLMAVSRIHNATQEHLHWCQEMINLRPWNREANITVGMHLAEQGKMKDAALRLILAHQESLFKDEKKEVKALLQQITQNKKQDNKINEPHRDSNNFPRSP